MHTHPEPPIIPAPASPSFLPVLPPSQGRRKARVLFINDTTRNGGPGRSLHTLLKFLDPRAVHRTVVVPREGAISELVSGVCDELLVEREMVENPFEPLRRLMERADFDAPLALRSGRVVANITRGMVALLRLRGLVLRGRFDLIYCNGTNANFGGAVLAASTRVPALWHVRYTSLPPSLVRVHARLAASRWVRRVVCVSRAASALFQGVPEKTTVIHNAVDVDTFASNSVVPSLRRELGMRDDAFVFGSHGRVLPRKGYVEMMRAAKIALAAMSAEERVRARFVIVGDTPADTRGDHLAECRALALSLGLQKNLDLTGFRPDVRPLVADFDVAVVPSVYADPAPRAVIEAMAMEKPVLAFDVGGVKEMLDPACGALVRPLDVVALAGEILRYMRDPELVRRQGKAARARVEREFDGASHARSVLREIERVVHGGRG